MKFITFKVIIEANQAKGVPPLGPVLGQHQINIMQFCKEYNQLTINYVESLPIRVAVVRYENKMFTILIKKPFFSFLFFQLFSDVSEKKKITLEQLFDLMCINFEFSQDKNFISHVVSLFATLTPLKVQIS